ncbi:MAG TPA: Mur ligase family protein [Gaiellaceae bacterium]|nr:Mur ligase family protein [Gaiellaceae bacterium]
MGAVAWIESLSPWPEEFGLERMHALLAALGDPQRGVRAVHVVGTNGKSTATRIVEALLAAEGLHVGAYLSPHVHGWSERIRIGGEEADFESAIARVRDEAERLDATQFEVLTAAAFLAFADAGVDAAVVEAGLGGRHDATNVLDAPVVLLTNVGLEHTDVLGSTREAIAREKLAVARQGAIVVLPDEEFAAVVPHARVVLGGAREAAEAFLGHPVDADVHVTLPGRLERRGPDEIWDGAHNADGLDWLLPRLPPGRYTVVASILRDKDAGAMLDRLARVARRLIATRSTNPRALPAEDLAALAQGRIASVEAVPDPAAALERAREDPPVLVTGSLYLLADLVLRQDRRVK